MKIMNVQIKFGKPGNYDYDMLLDQFGITKINSFKTSSIPLVQFWKDTEKRLTEVEANLHLQLNHPVLCFEYPTAPAQGKGGSSMTDLMILSDENKIAIEAKYTEYEKMPVETVAQWLQEGNSIENKEKVLQGWWSMIAPFRAGTSTPDTMGYQFLHRTASACQNTKQAVVIYQLFYDNETLPFLAAYKKLLAGYVAMVNPNENLKFYTWEIETKLLVPDDIKEQKPFVIMKRKPVYEFGATVFAKL
jgi:hypothetical protein